MFGALGTNHIINKFWVPLDSHILNDTDIPSVIVTVLKHFYIFASVQKKIVLSLKMYKIRNNPLEFQPFFLPINKFEITIYIEIVI